MTPAELRALYEAATPGLWAKAAHGQEKLGAPQWWTVNRAFDDGRVIQVSQAHQVARIMSVSRGAEDAALIVAMHAHLPALLKLSDEVKALIETVQIYGDARAKRWVIDLENAIDAVEKIR